MADVWASLLVSFGVVFVAELGDKSQLMAMTFATRHRARDVLVGIAVAAAVIQFAAAAVGAGIGAALPTGWLNLAAAAVFLGFAMWTLRRGSDSDEPEVAGPATRSSILAVGGAYFLAELGDKTMLATITLATQYHWIGVWIGATAGMVALGVLAIAVGRLIGQRLPEHIVRYGAAALFAIFGVVLAVEGVAELL